MTSESVMRKEKLHPLDAETKFEEIGVKCKSVQFEARMHWKIFLESSKLEERCDKDNVTLAVQNP